MKAYLILFSLIIVACLPLFGLGFYTSQDGENHLVRITNFCSDLKSGNLFPGWVDSLNKGQGYPIFYFTYPLPYYLSCIPNLIGFSAVDSLKIILGLATLASVWLFWKWSQSLPAALIFLFTPYRFVNLYVRGALGEIVFLPFLIGAFWMAKRKSFLGISIFTTLMILSHLQLSLVFIPILVVYNFKIWKGLLTGMLLSAFFWLPALVLLALTKHSLVHQFQPSDHIPGILRLLYSKWNYGFSPDGISLQVGIIQWLVLIIATLKFKSKPILGIIFLAIFLMTGASSWIWKTGWFDWLQFPWRLLVIPMVLIPVLLPKSWPKLVLAIFLTMAIYSNRNHIRINQTVFEDVSDNYFLANEGTTTSTADEFMPLRSKEFFQTHPIILTSRAISLSALLAMGVIGLLKSKYGSFSRNYRS